MSNQTQYAFNMAESDARYLRSGSVSPTASFATTASYADASMLQDFMQLAYLQVSFGTGQGGQQNFAPGVPGSEDDGRVYFSNLTGYSLDDQGNNYSGNGSGTGNTDYYTVPFNGVYQIVTTLRWCDGTTPSTSDTAGGGLGGAKPGELVLGSHDYPGFGWISFGNALRGVYQNIRTISLNAGDNISMVTDDDRNGGGTIVDYCSDGVMTISLETLT